MAGGQDRLSELPNDLLRRVLHFAPLKEAASTTALSRRWRAPLWLSSGAVNLETGVDNNRRRRHDDDKARFFSTRDAFVSAAAGALDAADVPVTRLTLRLDSDLKAASRYTGLVGIVLSHRAARRVEELRLVARQYWCECHDFGNTRPERLYTVTLHSLPLIKTLRVLDLANCEGLLYRREAAAPRLSSIRLSHCNQHLCSLQRVMDAAPALLAVRLESVSIDATDQDEATTRRQLRCPAATILVLNSCTWMVHKHKPGHYYKQTVDVDDLDIVAPRLRSFTYKGPLRSLSFSPLPPDLERVDLDLSGHGNYENNKDTDHDIVTLFWRFARSFTSAKEMRLKVNHLDDIAVLSEARRVELLPTFRRLRRLEVQGVDFTKGKTPAAVTILILLRCCPVLSALRINLTPERHHDHASNKNVEPDTRIPQKEIQISALAPYHLFKCLQNSLRRVALRFQLDKSNCLGVKLIKFFAENAMALEEMYVDAGEEKFCEQMNPKIQKWNSKRRNLGATTFVVLPLKR
ncbi:hypothetical protein QYE76_059050 [Lolium multiflorum]|uniref:F-box domain-containing protein n=1 Tax=Lolium multiflorum TaxID=4521 RepID=A0AAD8T6K2_LOLMU|nr:hypothetical protein QYE76_059050 [Lolium multiflorum]